MIGHRLVIFKDVALYGRESLIRAALAAAVAKQC
jgi:hypothetical protein